MVSGNNSPDFPEIEFDVEGASLTRANLTVRGRYTFADEDDRDVRWGLMSGADAEHFTIRKDANGNGVLTFKNPSPETSRKPADYENPVDMGSNNVYRVVITADDRQNESNSVGTFTVDVTVTPVDETPEITTTGATHATPSFAEIEYDATTADLTVADYDARDEEREPITWGLGGDDAGDFTINRNSGVLSFAQRPNFEIPVDGSTPPDNVYNIIVEATDASPTRNIREFPVTVTVTNVDETPEITNPPSDRSYAEIEYDSGSTATDIPVVATFTARDEEMQDITWGLSGDDAGDFTITKDPNTGNGVITFKTSRPTSRFPKTPTPTQHLRVHRAGDGHCQPHEHRRLGLRRHRHRCQRAAGVHGNYRDDVRPARARRERGLHDDVPGVLRRPRRRRRGHLDTDRHGPPRLRDRRRRRRHLRRRAQLRNPGTLQQHLSRSRSSLPTSRAARLAGPPRSTLPSPSRTSRKRARSR